MATITTKSWTKKDGSAGKGFVVYFKDRSGKRKSKQFKKRREAEAFRNSSPGTAPVQAKRGSTVQDASDAWIAACKAGRRGNEPVEPTTVESYESLAGLHINPRIGGREVTEISKEDVEAFRGEILDDISRPMAKIGTRRSVFDL